MAARSEGTIETEVERLRRELELIGKARNGTELGPEILPELARLAPGGVDSIHRLIEDAASTMSEREARAVEVLLSDSDVRWNRSLRDRMSEAGPLLGVATYHTFRDRSRKGVSHYDAFLLKVANRIVQNSRLGESEPVAVSEQSGPARLSQRRELAVGLVAVVLALGAVVVVLGYRGSGGAAQASEGPWPSTGVPPRLGGRL